LATASRATARPHRDRPRAGIERLRADAERIKLTAVYGGLLVLVCAASVVLVFALVHQGLPTNISNALTARNTPGLATPAGHSVPVSPASGARRDPADTIRIVTATAARAALDRLLTASLIAVVVFGALSVLLAWWMAGRVLRPVAVITATARRLSATHLHERIGLTAPDGELKRLADTFDEMLDRIEQLVSAQQRFVANAAHELRTRVAVQRSAAEIGLAQAEPSQVARIRRKLLEAADDSERLIEGLLLLAVSDQGVQCAEPVRLDALSEAVADAVAHQARERDVSLRVLSEPLTVPGDAVLLWHLIHNLASNAVRHNVAAGIAEITIDATGMTVRNTGPAVPAEAVPHLFEPFHRLQPRRHAPGEGAGLGLSIVASIARAHAATITTTPNPGGGLTIHLGFASPATERTEDDRK
jgi:signal transduction histidine kinase